MIIENTTDENIYIFAGIFVPGRGSLAVQHDALDRVRASPLIADYVSAGALLIVDAAALAPKRETPDTKAETKK